MDFERWKVIDSLLQQALDRPSEDRDAFLQSACQGDAELRRKEESIEGFKTHIKSIHEKIWELERKHRELGLRAS